MSGCSKCGGRGAYYAGYGDQMGRRLTYCDCGVTRKVYDDMKDENDKLKEQLRKKGV